MLCLSSPIVTIRSSSISAVASTTPFRRSYSFPLASASTFEGSTRSPYLQRPHGMATTCISLYEVLGLSMGASVQEIKSAYRRMARVCHPDVAAIERKDSSVDEFMRIHAAYSTLSDPAKRAVYDGNLYRKNRPLTSVGVGYRGRNWETDQCW